MSLSEPADFANRRYSTAAMVLHWLTAAAIVVQIGLGWFMVEIEDSKVEKQFEGVHISIGLTVLILTLVRLGLRLTRRTPPLPAGMAKWERLASKAVHVLFYVMLLALPLTGWIMESVGKRPIPFWGAAWPHFPGLAAMLEGHDKGAFKDNLEGIHGSPLVWIMIALVAVHVIGAIKHQFDGSPILWRMVPFFKRP